MPDKQKREHKQERPIEAPRKREAVLADFRTVAGPLRGQNRNQKPKS